MKHFYAFLFTLALSTGARGANITIIQPYNAIYTSDTVWRFVANSMGHNAVIVQDTILDNTFFFSNTDILITPVYDLNYPANRISNIIAFMQTGKSVYLQSEYDLTFNGNQAFEDIVSNLGGSFTWTGTVAGVLAPMNVLGSLGTTPLTIPPLTYFWYGCNASVCNYFDSFLEYNGDYFGFTFCPPGGSSGRLMTTSDQDWIIQMTSMDLMRNMIDLLLQPPANCGLNTSTITLGNDTTLCTGDFLVLGTGISATSWLWSNGATTNVIIVDTTGTYWLQATAGGCSATDTIQVQFIPCSITASFTTADPTICPGTCTDFTNFSFNATSYQWLFPGGNPSASTDVNPLSICYNAPGNYDVTLIATDGLLYDTLVLTSCITVFPYPPAQGIVQSGDTLTANQGSVSYQWYHNGNIIPGATEYFFIASNSGNYNVVCTDSNGCEVEAVIFDVIASAPDLSLPGSSINAFPNPVENILNLTVQENLIPEIFNSLGQRLNILSGKYNKGIQQYDVTSLAKGVYYIEVRNAAHITRIKFIKQ